MEGGGDYKFPGFNRSNIFLTPDCKSAGTPGGLAFQKKDCKSGGTPGGLAFQKKEEEGML